MTGTDLLIGAPSGETGTGIFHASARRFSRLVGKIGRGSLAAVLLIGMAYPFLNEAYHRHAVAERLAGALDERDRAAFEAWQGDAPSFARHLHARCELTFGKYAPGCDRYRLATEQ